MSIFKTLISKTTTAIVAGTMALILTACGTKNNNDTLVVGTSADNPPFEFTQDGRVIGFDIDLVEMIGEKLGKKIVIKEMDFPGLIPALSSGHIDIAIAGVSIEEARRENVDFTVPYVDASVAMLVKQNSGINNPADLSGKKIGAQIGSTWLAVAKDLATKISNIEVFPGANNLVLIEELKNNNINALVMEEHQMKKVIQQQPELTGFVLADVKSELAIVLKKSSTMTEEINKVLKELEEQGKIAELKEKWLKN